MGSANCHSVNISKQYNICICKHKCTFEVKYYMYKLHVYHTFLSACCFPISHRQILEEILHIWITNKRYSNINRKRNKATNNDVFLRHQTLTRWKRTCGITLCQAVKTYQHLLRVRFKCLTFHFHNIDNGTLKSTTYWKFYPDVAVKCYVLDR